MRILSAIFVGIGLALFLHSAFKGTKNDACEDAWDRMDSLVKCMEKPGCFYDAEMLYEGQKAYSYYDENCRDHRMYDSSRYRGEQN